VAEKDFDLEIRTPQRSIFTGKIASLVAPGTLGYLGVLAHHAPLLSTLAPGKVIFREPGGRATTLQSKGSGLLEVYRNRAILLSDDIS
jgi:F-type H+-transporting ATPase subunit epsilon